MKKWKFYIDNIEVNEPNNWAEFGSKAERSIERWGLFREVVPTEVEWGQVINPRANAFQILKDKWELNGVNSLATFRVDKYNPDTGIYGTYQTFEFDFSTYKEVFKFAKKAVISISLISSDIYKKLEQRWNQDFKIGNNKDFQGNNITPVSSADVIFRAMPLKYETSYENGLFAFLSGYAGSYYFIDSGGDANYFQKVLIFPIKTVTNNIDFSKNQVYKKIDLLNINTTNNSISPPFPILTEKIGTESTFLIQNNQAETVNINYDFNIFFTGFLVNNGNLRIVLYSANIASSGDFIDVVLEDESLFYFPAVAESNVTKQFNGSFQITKQPTRVYWIGLQAESGTNTFIFPAENGITANVNVDYNNIQLDTTHKSYSLKNCFTSLLRQITGINNILDATLFDSGVFNDIYITNGQLLRNAESIDGVQPDLELNMESLWKTMRSLYPLGMDIRNNKVFIGYRPSLFGLEEVEIEPTEFTVMIADEMMYNAVNVGNKRVQYEQVNGTEEFNTELNFTNNLLFKDNVLDLVSKYNTDYLAVELARRLSFATADKVDTKYDDKVMVVNTVGSPLRTRRFTNGAGSNFSNYVFPSYIYNLPFTPKRMLLRNSDLLQASMWKTEGDLTFRKIENQSNLISRTNYLSESQNITEREDVIYSRLARAIFEPIYYECVVGEKDLENIIQNRNKIFKFVVRGEVYKGYLWSGELTKDSGTIKLLKAVDPISGLQLTLQNLISSGG
jgi:hypothetical protein